MMKKMKKVSAMLLTLMMAFSLAIPALAADGTGFSDVPADADYAEAVAWCAETNLMQGVSSNNFDPNGSMTRAMLATILYRQAGEPAVSGNPNFTDVQPNAWYSNAILWAAERELLQGYGGGVFGTNDSVSREMLNLVIARQNGENPVWTGAPELAVNAKRSEAAMALYHTFAKPVPDTDTASAHILIAYFSATNRTEGVANQIKATLGDEADVYEILAETPYTSADLNYNTDCRANREQNDPNARPAITGRVENMEQYDVIFLGYPIWWGQAPKIMYTFVEAYDLSGKIIVPFCTSGSSGIGSSATNLAEVTIRATWLDGQRFSGGTSSDDVKSWVDGLDLGLGGDNR